MFFFFFNDTATTEIYTLSLHDALPICGALVANQEQAVRAGITSPDTLVPSAVRAAGEPLRTAIVDAYANSLARSEEHTSELPSRQYLVCRFLLEKKILPYEINVASSHK